MGWLKSLVPCLGRESKLSPGKGRLDLAGMLPGRLQGLGQVLRQSCEAHGLVRIPSSQPSASLCRFPSSPVNTGGV